MNAIRLACALAVLLLSHAGGAAQTPADQPVLIRAGRLFDSRAGRLLPARDILVRGTRIDSVAEQIAAPAGARVIDLRGYTVLPGLIDAHMHLLYLENPGAGLSMEGVRAVTMEGDALRALRGAARARTFLDAGITTVRDLGNSGRFADVALRRAIQEGSVPGPRLYVSGPGLSPEGGQFPGLLPEHRELADAEYRIVRGAEDARAAVREAVTFGANVIKIYANNTPNPGYLSIEEMTAIVDEARLMRVPVAAHATNDVAIRRATLAGVTSIEHAYQVSDSTLALMASRGVALVPTDVDTLVFRLYLARMQPAEPVPPQAIQRQIDAYADRLRRAAAAGVTIAAGSDNYLDLGIPQGAAAKRVLFAYENEGMERTKILQAATSIAAGVLGEPRLGRLEKGAFADIIAVDGNPLDDLRALERVVFVMANGTVHREGGAAAR